MLKIEQISDGHTTTLRLIGRIQSEHIECLKAQIAAQQCPIMLDLDEVSLVDIEVIRFLSIADFDGITLCNCPLFIREWIVREQDQNE